MNMGNSRTPNGANDIYRNHLQGTPFKNNPTNNRVGMLERMYLRILTELAMNRFKWSGLPESVDVRFLELNLFYRALSVFYYDKHFEKYFALQSGSTTYLNMMNNPTAFVVIGNQFVNKTIGAYDPAKKYAEDEAKDKGIPIWANFLRVPDLDIVSIYASKLAQLDRTVEINAQNARMSKVMVSNEQQKLSVVNINRAIDEGQNGISVNGAAQDMQFLQAVDLGVNPDLIDKVHILRTRIWNECMGLLGIENANQDKKERLVSAEVDANQDQTSMTRYVNLNARRTACDQINKVFGMDVSVEYYTEVERESERATEDSESETAEDE
jgi:connector GP10